MASFAKETLSPLLKSTTMRRRSLDICQKIGNHLLSPNAKSLFPSSPSKSSASASPSPTSNKGASPSPTSPFKLLSPVFNYSYEPATNDLCTAAPSYHYKRRASDSLWIDTLPTEPSSEERSKGFQKRRCSLTLQNLSPSTLLHPEKSKKNGGEAEDHLKGTPQPKRLQTQEPTVTCNVIPPTPLRTVKQRNMPSSKFQLDNDHHTVEFSLSTDSCDREEEETPTDQTENGLDINHNYAIFKEGKRKCAAIMPDPSSPNEGARRGSAKYDLDDSLISLVTQRWNLCLNPDELLGKGSFGTVVGGTYQGKKVAVKVLKTTNAQRKASVLGEDNALNLPSHNHIARIHDILYLGPDRTLIIMEKLEKGNLLSLLNDSEFKINCSIAINFSKQIALALVFCHRQGILHLDVKPQNILVDERNCCKLSDFGSSKRVVDVMEMEDQKRPMLEGTVPYTAPELFKGSRPAEKCDVYSFGVNMWQILTREVPYENENEHSVIFRVVSQGLRPSSTDINANNFSNEQTDLVLKYSKLYEQAWSANPDLRPRMTDIHKSLIEIQLLELN